VEGKGIVVGRLQNWKGPEVLCQAAELLGAKAPKIIWVGRDTPFRLRQRWMSTHLKESYGNVWEKIVLPAGEKSRLITGSMQAAAKFVVVPSTWDTFNLAAVEAMSASKIVICSDGAGVSRLIRHGENGFKFPAGDPKRLAVLLTEVDNLSQEAQNKIGQSARNTVERELNPDLICALRIDRYRHLKESKRIARRQHRWVESMFDSKFPEPPFAFLSSISAKYLTDNIPIRHLAKLTLRRAWHRIRTTDRCRPIRSEHHS
jgi:glycosyltransferase involved in cell wall biosynthesis